MDENAKIPAVDAPIEERLLFLQENMVNFVKQYNLPDLEQRAIDNMPSPSFNFPKFSNSEEQGSNAKK